MISRDADIYKQFSNTRRAVVPLVGIETTDAFGTEGELVGKLGESKRAAKTPLIRWTALTGLEGLNEQGRKALEQAAPETDIPSITTNPLEMLMLVATIKADDVTIFAHGLHRYMLGFGQNADPMVCSVTQGVQNLRDRLKRLGGMLVILGSSFSFPAEVTADFVMLSQPLPTDEMLKTKLEQMIAANAAAMDIPVSEGEIDTAVFAVKGLTMFSAEQAFALNLRKGGLDIDGLWDTKRSMISSTPGLTLWEGTETLEDVLGNEAVIDELKALVMGRRRPGCIVFIDEIEKGMAGATSNTSDSSGVSQGFLGGMLEYMEDTDSIGVLSVGVPGAGKSLIAKAIGNYADIPTIQFDLKEMRNQFVGSSEARLREAFRVVTAVSGGSALFIATSNNIEALPPELKRRFNMGTFFFDLPTQQEVHKMWEMYINKFELEGETVPDPELWRNWTGAEVKACCNKAERTGRPIAKCIGQVVPVAVSGRALIEALRKAATGVYLSSSYAGPYKGAEYDILAQTETTAATKRGSTRRVRMED